MKIRDTFPRPIREIENIWIPMPDGVRLAARVWMPEDAESHPAPAILEYVPYRKRDMLRARDESIHRYFAGHGYAAVRLDLRGTGESEGVLRDEYLPQELDDAEAAIVWIAAQPWCSGRVGMMGKSWGGFNALQVAARRPPALGAIITVCSTDDRYADDAHYMGGCLIADNFGWGSSFFNLAVHPPDPALVGDGWRAMWMERLEAVQPFPAVWLEHQRRDAYWKHGSVCEDYAAIECPVYAVGGWADAYSNAVSRLLAGLSCPRKGLVGPWGHQYPQDGVPGPAIGFLQEALRWWDHWLKGIDTGIMDEPAYRVWMQDSVPPRATYRDRPGRWVSEETWPSPRIVPRELPLSPGRIEPEGANVPDAALDVSSPQSVGIASGAWCGFGTPGEMPLDQRIDDGGSLVFDSDPLDAPIEMLGAAVLDAEIASDRPVALIAVRLSDVAPDGAATRVTYGVLNLTHRDGHERPSPLEPGRRTRVRVALNDAAHSFARGRRLRIAISTSYWPIVWPAPENVRLTVHTGASRLVLPVRPRRAEDAALAPFEPPEAAPGPAEKELNAPRMHRIVERDLRTGETLFATGVHGGDLDAGRVTWIEDIDVEYGQAMSRRSRIRDDDPLSAESEHRHRAHFRRDGWHARVDTRVRVSCTGDSFRVEAQMDAWEGETRLFSRAWDRRIARDHV
jgi:hypothetical protein